MLKHTWVQKVTGQIYGRRKKSLSTTAKYKDALLTQKYLKCNLQSSGVGMDILGKGFSILALPLYPSISTIMVY